MGTQDYFQLSIGLGGARRDRTADLLHAMQALSQLSYSPTEPRTLRRLIQTVKITASNNPLSRKSRACSRSRLDQPDGMIKPRNRTFLPYKPQSNVDGR